MRSTHDVPFTLTEIVCRVLPILLEARQKYSPESSSETLVMRRALLKFSNLALSDGRSPPFLYQAMSGVGLGEGPSGKRGLVRGGRPATSSAAGAAKRAAAPGHQGRRIVWGRTCDTRTRTTAGRPNNGPCSTFVML